MPLDGVGGVGDPPGTDGARGALQRMGSVESGPHILGLMDGSQMPHALLGEEGEELAFEIMVAAGLAGEMVEINGGLGHLWL